MLVALRPQSEHGATAQSSEQVLSGMEIIVDPCMLGGGEILTCRSDSFCYERLFLSTVMDSSVEEHRNVIKLTKCFIMGRMMMKNALQCIKNRAGVKLKKKTLKVKPLKT